MKKNLPITNRNVDYPAAANILTTTDTKGTITYANEDFVAISGFSLPELQGKSHNMVRHPEMPPAAFDSLWRTIKAGKSWNGMVKNRCKNGDHYWVDAYVTPMMKNGAPVEYQSVRKKPKDHAYIQRAEELYGQINSGKSPGFLSSPPLSMPLKSILAASVVLIVMLGVGGLLSWISWLQALMGAVVGIGAIAAAISVIAQPFNLLVQRARQVTEDRAGQYIFTGRTDEVGQVLYAMKMLQSESVGIVGRMADSAETMLKESAALNRAVEVTSEGMGRLYTETDQVATAIDEMTASISEVASNARLTAEAATTAHAGAEEGKHIVLSTTHTIQGLATQIEQAADAIRTVESDSTSINAILDVIRAISEQTNLLALNAAIEAARAGEQGRGFAVVADEVRTLASRTNVATTEIQSLMEKLQRGSKAAVGVMEASQRQAAESVQQAEHAVNSLENITQAVASINDMSLQISHAVNEQSQVAEEVNRSVVTIRDAAETTMDSSRSSEKVAETIRQMSNRMREVANQFWSNRG